MARQLIGLQLKPLKTRPSNLPSQRTGLVGRDLKRLPPRNSAPPNMKLVTITAQPESAKRALPCNWRRNDSGFPGGVILSACGYQRSCLNCFVIGQTLGIRESGGQSPLETLKEFLQNPLCTPMLALYNFEHLVSAASMLADSRYWW